MIDTQAIRSKILDLAMRGKLTEQLPEDGTAEELYRQIQAEKQALIKAGKIKKEKPLPEIATGEIPFEIPTNWKWVRIGATFHVEMGQSPDGASVLKNGKGIEFHQGKINFGPKYIIDSKQRTSKPTKIAEANSVLVCVRAPVGKVNITQRKICIGRGLCAITPSSNVNLDFLFHYLVTCEKVFADQGTGSTFSAIGGEIIKKQLCPLPPLAEQHRIVSRIEQAFSALDTIDTLQAKYADNLAVLKSKLIDAAIQGKLTEQLPEDGTAEDLYRLIQAEKQALIKSGKIMKEKPLPEIEADEAPFEIPANWKWVHLSDITTTNIGLTYHPEDIAEDGTIVVRSSNIINSRMDYADLVKVRCHIRENQYLNNKDIVICARNGSKALVGKCAIYEGESGKIAFGAFMAVLRTPFYRFVFYYLHTNAFRRYFHSDDSKQINQVTQNILKEALIPLPPLAEQKRIVAKLEEVLEMIGQTPPRALWEKNSSASQGVGMEKETQDYSPQGDAYEL